VRGARRTASPEAAAAPALAAAWPAVLTAAGAGELAAYLRLAMPLRLEGDRLVLGLPLGHEFQRDQLGSDRWRAPLEALLRQAYGEAWRVRCVCDAAVAPPAAPAPTAPAAEGSPHADAVQRVLRAFDGRVVGSVDGDAPRSE
jgi:hypothetical protein